MFCQSLDFFIVRFVGLTETSISFKLALSRIVAIFGTTITSSSMLSPLPLFELMLLSLLFLLLETEAQRWEKKKSEERQHKLLEKY